MLKIKLKSILKTTRKKIMYREIKIRIITNVSNYAREKKTE